MVHAVHLEPLWLMLLASTLFAETVLAQDFPILYSATPAHALDSFLMPSLPIMSL